MKRTITITVHGEPSDAVFLESGEPIADVECLELEYRRNTGIALGPAMRAYADAYRDGAYRIAPRRTTFAPSVGVFRARGVTVSYLDGTVQFVPLDAEVVVEVSDVADARDAPRLTVRAAGYNDTAPA